MAFEIGDGVETCWPRKFDTWAEGALRRGRVSKVERGQACSTGTLITTHLDVVIDGRETSVTKTMDAQWFRRVGEAGPDLDDEERARATAAAKAHDEATAARAVAGVTERLAALHAAVVDDRDAMAATEVPFGSDAEMDAAGHRAQRADAAVRATLSALPADLAAQRDERVRDEGERDGYASGMRDAADGWTHNGEPLGPKTRPWRLTRRQRVEMEAALARLRRDTLPVRRGAVGARPDVVVRAETALCHAPRATYVLHTLGVGSPREWRILRARVAIALRAALRADEDARCEEAERSAVARYAECDEWDYRQIREAAEEHADAMRDWPQICPTDLREVPEAQVLPALRGWWPGSDRAYRDRFVPLALWERASLLPEPPTGVGG